MTKDTINDGGIDADSAEGQVPSKLVTFADAIRLCGPKWEARFITKHGRKPSDSERMEFVKSLRVKLGFKEGK